MITVDNTKYGYIYRVTNMLNDKTYIGQHKIFATETWTKYMGSGRLIKQALRKYGSQNFRKELLCYADSKPELNVLEKKYIEYELLANKAEYNVMNSEINMQIRMKDLNIDDEKLLSMYLDKKMSYSEIADTIGCSVPSIYTYMKKFRENNDLFLQENKNRYAFSEKTIRLGTEAAHRKIPCENCGKKITLHNYRVHSRACIDDNYYDGHRKHQCSYDDCETMIHVKNLLCRAHYFINGFPGVSDSDSVRQGGLVASHNRWHVKRGIVNPNCDLCNKNDQTNI